METMSSNPEAVYHERGDTQPPFPPVTRSVSAISSDAGAESWAECMDVAVRTALRAGQRKRTTRWREEFWYCMRKSGVSEKYVRVVQDSVIAVKCAVGTTDWFNVEAGLHQGSALSPFLFAVVMDRLMDKVRQESPWTMMFADDIVICGELFVMVRVCVMQEKRVSSKSTPTDLVTEADQHVEEMIISTLREKFPSHGEGGVVSDCSSSEGRCGLRWVSPSDGEIAPVSVSPIERGVAPVSLSPIERGVAPVSLSPIERGVAPVLLSSCGGGLATVSVCPSERGVASVSLSPSEGGVAPVSVSPSVVGVAPVSLSSSVRRGSSCVSQFQCSFIGEESSAAGEKCVLTDSPTWIIDPIDGTCNFVHRLMFLSDVSKALILTEIGAKRDPHTLDIFLENMKKMLSAPTHGVRIIGSSTLALCHVASGAAEAYYQYGLHCWDIAAAALIITEAGGCVIDTTGGPLDLMSRRVVAAGSRKIADYIIQKLKPINYGRDDDDDDP
ncbi:inositol monophosphatase 2 [Silurus meridionalis]|nr:inositol monophosphatase 2 [Silurus meridionalis]